MNHLPHADAMVMVEDAGLFVDALDGFQACIHPTSSQRWAIRAFCGCFLILLMMTRAHQEPPFCVVPAVSALGTASTSSLGEVSARGPLLRMFKERLVSVSTPFLFQQTWTIKVNLSARTHWASEYARPNLWHRGAVHQAPVQPSRRALEDLLRQVPVQNTSNKQRFHHRHKESRIGWAEGHGIRKDRRWCVVPFRLGVLPRHRRAAHG